MASKPTSVPPAKSDSNTKAGMEDSEDSISFSYQQGRNWEDRGTVLGLVIEAVGRAAGQVMLLIPMLVHALAGDEHFNTRPCRDRDNFSGIRMFFCEYFTAYSVAFPVLATTGMMLVVGRNLLQKRLYYHMLQAGGVITFGQNDALKDVLVWIVVWCYLHVVGYFCFVINICYNDGTFQFNGGHMKVEEEAQPMIVGCLSLLVLPSTFFTVFFYCAYDVEGTLVPLSQYVHDAKDMSEFHEEAPEAWDALANLEVMSDAITKTIVQEKADELFQTSGNYEAKLGDLLRMYIRAESDHDENELPSIGLFMSFWPGRVLLRPGLTGGFASRFKYLWFSVCAIVMVVFGVLFHFLGMQIMKDVLVMVDGQKQALPHLVVLSLHLIVVGAFCLPFIRTIMHACERSPLAGQVGADSKLTA